MLLRSYRNLTCFFCQLLMSTLISELSNYQTKVSSLQNISFKWLWRSLPGSICLYLLKLTSAFPFTQRHIIEICCINHKIIPLNNHFCCSFQRHSNSSGNLSISYFSSASLDDCLYCYLKAHFISLPNIQFHGGMRKRCLSLLLTKVWQHYSMLTLLPPPQRRHSLPSPLLSYLINSVLARLTVGFRLALLGVTSSWMVSQLTGAAPLLCCDNIRLMSGVVVLGCHVLPFCSFTFLFLLCLDLTAVTRRRRSQLAWPESVTATRKLPFFPPLIGVQCAYIHTEKCSHYSRLKHFNWLSILPELVSQDAAEGASDV